MLKCKFFEPTDKVATYFRRFCFSNAERPTVDGHYHSAKVFAGYIAIPVNEAISHDIRIDKTDSRWPSRCECGYVFQDDDQWQIFADRIYICKESGEEHPLRELPPGAMYYVDHLEGIAERCGPDGKSLIAITPDGHPWNIDGRASNCTMKDDKVHKCWVRHGTPPNITVDKNGHTCRAGAGSIATKKYHGFLRNGEFT